MATALLERMMAVTGERTYRAIAELTKTNSETVRRYMQGQAPSVEFLASLCVALGVNGEWLLCGRGPMRADDVRVHALKEASGPELLGAMATAVEKLTERVERLEVYVQTQETRMRVAAGTGEGGGGETSAAAAPRERTDEQTKTPPAQATKRARKVADAITKRPRADDR